MAAAAAFKGFFRLLQHEFGAPRDPSKELGQEETSADEVVASVGGGTETDVESIEILESVVDDFERQCGAVASEDDDPLRALAKGALEECREPDSQVSGRLNAGGPGERHVEVRRLQ